jgi:hypothetical protein
MSANLIQTIKKNLGYAELKKIDPNTQQPIADGKEEDKLNQAAIPAVLIVIYKFTRTDEGAQQVMTSSLTNDWLNMMLGDDTADAIIKVSGYSGVSEVNAAERMELIAKQAVGVIREANPLSVKDVKNIVAAERNNILLYLPPSLHMGDLLHDNTLDDNITKMQGPVSSIVNAIGNVFAGSEKGKDD